MISLQENKETNKESVILLIIDGFGISNKTDLSENIYKVPSIDINLSDKVNNNLKDKVNDNFNAIRSANTFSLNYLSSKYPSFLLEASSTYVGLLKDQIGNSEVGHLTIGAGRIVQQPITRINEDSLRNKLNNSLFNKLDQFNKIHIIGMFSDTGVHSHINHIKYLLNIFKEKSIEVNIHAISDGIDTITTFSEFLNELNDEEIKKIKSLSGRIYAMSRTDYNLTQKYFNCITNEELINNESINIIDYINNYIKEDDEYIKPICFNKDGYIKKDDLVIFSNFRSDRMKQIYKLFIEYNCKTITMTDFGIPSINNIILFNNTIIKNTLGEILTKNNIKQVRIAEKDKKAHVTYFMNGLRFNKFNNEYHYFFEEKEGLNRKVEMSIFKILDKIILLMSKQEKQLIICNLANADIFGHTGSFEKTRDSIDLIDIFIGMIYQSIKKYNYKLLITSDHGNAEEMMINNKINKKHTNNPVPFIIINTKAIQKDGILKKGFSLQDIAPTILNILNIEKPNEMTGESLLFK